ncbi:hypothetical protein [Thermococcus sp. Bubb.Bath]|uniref:hypothetical protein n=1 Tax=Thermococcus sp. Bubb.Bath TaxID=1638242 RepID=UPI00143A2570|nr:hypothetical protein [Thermococcus sp. Bubb.Bath]NJF25878.1 hypothetical protein [Thermococcus sp. Bubb.Bath]
MGDDKMVKIKSIAGVILIFLGILLVFLPLASYYLESYKSAEFRDKIVPGSEFQYFGIVGQFPAESGDMLSFGFEINVTYLGPNKYNVSYAVYKLYGDGGLDITRYPKFPLYARLIKKASEGNLVTSKVGLISKLMPEELNSEDIVNVTHSYPNKFYGYPRIYFMKSGDEYMKYKNSYVAISTSFQSPCVDFGMLYNLTGMCTKLSRLSGQNMSAVEKSLVGEIYLARENTAPPQDWGGWLKYGISVGFPVDIAILMLGLITLIIGSRE